MIPQIGLQLSSLSEHLKTEEALKRTFERVSEIGYKNVQIQGIADSISADLIANCLRENGLCAVASQEDYAFGFDVNYRAAIERAAVCGCRYLSVALMPKEYASAGGIELFAERLVPIIESAERYGIIVSFHPIGSDYRAIGGIPIYERLLKRLPELHLTLCVHAAYSSNADIHKIAASYGARMELVHFKDSMKLPDGSIRMTPLGMGAVSYERYYKQLCQADVKYIFAEQERHDADSFTNITVSYEYLRWLTNGGGI